MGVTMFFTPGKQQKTILNFSSLNSLIVTELKHQKILNLLNEANDSKFLTRKWTIVNNISNANYGLGNEIIYNKEVLKSNLCDNNDAYILVRGDIGITEHGATQVAFKNFAPFTKCVTKIDEKTIDEAENLGLVVSMYNLIEYSSNYSKRTESLWVFF